MGDGTVVEELLTDLKAWFWEQDGFAGEVYAFADQHADFFESVRQYFEAGGHEHPLDWTQLHQQFADHFGGHLEAFLASRGCGLEVVQEALTLARERGDEEAAVMVDVMLSIADYQPWLRSMLALALERTSEAAAPPEVEEEAVANDSGGDEDFAAFRCET
mmetsp:Transcript_37928/g.80609  ORF Transcript_37928/g.80609 Transcript_37928/m.80609 type:complete len:161 (-) Transcript_37928:106-588(-)